jgi:hypothetical protein
MGVAGGLVTTPGSTIVGNCTRWAHALGAANRQQTARAPRIVQAVESVKAFKLGTEYERRESARAEIFERALNISPPAAGQGQPLARTADNLRTATWVVAGQTLC